MSEVSHEEITELFEQWNQALQTGDPKVVAALYEPDAILLPTLSNQVRHNHPEIEDYFVHFLAKGPKERSMNLIFAWRGRLRFTPGFIPLPSRMAARRRRALPMLTVRARAAGRSSSITHLYCLNSYLWIS